MLHLRIGPVDAVAGFDIGSLARGGMRGIQMKRIGVIGALAAALGACASFSPISRIEARLLEFGFSRPMAECFASGLGDKLDNRQLDGVADLLEGFENDRKPEQAIERLGRGVGSPEIAGAVASTAFSCAIGRGR